MFLTFNHGIGFSVTGRKCEIPDNNGCYVVFSYGEDSMGNTTVWVNPKKSKFHFISVLFGRQEVHAVTSFPREISLLFRILCSVCQVQFSLS